MMSFVLVVSFSNKEERFKLFLYFTPLGRLVVMTSLGRSVDSERFVK